MVRTNYALIVHYAHVAQNVGPPLLGLQIHTLLRP
jgi:hypothetical protein